jgi:hypothetical protein
MILYLSGTDGKILAFVLLLINERLGWKCGMISRLAQLQRSITDVTLSYTVCTGDNEGVVEKTCFSEHIFHSTILII